MQTKIRSLSRTDFRLGPTLKMEPVKNLIFYTAVFLRNINTLRFIESL